MPGAKHYEVGTDDLVYEHVWSDHEFERTGKCADASTAWVDARAIGCRDKCYRRLARRRRIVLSDVGSDCLDIRTGRISEPYLHRGGGTSVSVPHDNSQRRTSS